MATTATEKVSTCNFFKRFPICAVLDPSERLVLIETVKTYLTTDKFSIPCFNFLEPKDIKIALDFFAEYGQDLKNIEIVNCRTVNNIYCTCFIKDYTAADEEFFKKILLSLEAPPNTAEFSFFSQRDINLFASFMLVNSEILRNSYGQ